MPPVITKGPNGTIEMKCVNAVQGSHSQYFAPSQARWAADALLALAAELEAESGGLKTIKFNQDGPRR